MNAENKHEITIDDQTFRLEEMCDAIDASIKNLQKVKFQQDRLIELVEENDKAEFFKDFVEESKEQIEKLKEQEVSLMLKYDFLTQVVDACKNNKDVAKAISMLGLALGFFGK